jgi:hypothetical protein
VTTRRDPTRLYDPEHDRLWAAVRLLRLTVILLALAVVAIAVAGVL